LRSTPLQRRAQALMAVVRLGLFDDFGTTVG
jgi:hypothetical protein